MRKILIATITILSFITTTWAQERRMLTWDDEQTALTQDTRRMTVAHAPKRPVVGRREEIPAIPVVLVNFSNRSLVTPTWKIDSMFNAQNWNLDGATGSVRQYFSDASSGNYQPRFDIYGPVTVSRSDTEYGKFCPGLVQEVVNLIKDSIDFSQYDADNDGIVDLVYMLYAGYGQQDGEDVLKTIGLTKPQNLIWPHWSGTTISGTYNGKQIFYYEVSNELDAFMKQDYNLEMLYGIGLACHEFCHALGLPDTYNILTTGDQHIVGKWDIMDYGCYNNNVNTPVTLSAWERWFMGWITPTLLTDSGDYTLPEFQESNEAYLITHDGLPQDDVNSTEWYYLLENRQRTGWDSYAPGHGLLLWKISKPSANSNWQGCNNSNPRHIDIVRADGTFKSIGKRGDCFPYGATSYQMTENYGFNNVTEDTILTTTADGTTESVEIAFHLTSSTGTATLFHGSAKPANKEIRKIILNGQTLIQNGNNLYDLSGGLVYHQVPPRLHKVPAYPGVIQRAMANGDTLSIYLRGDERRHWVMTIDGYEVEEKDNLFYYVRKNGKLSKHIATNEDKRSRFRKWWLRHFGKKHEIKD